jgi:hypothetical protein
MPGRSTRSCVENDRDILLFLRVGAKEDFNKLLGVTDKHCQTLNVSLVIVLCSAPRRVEFIVLPSILIARKKKAYKHV